MSLGNPLEQFHWSDIRCENILDYEPGGYHPVHLGDTFSILPHSTLPRYRVVNKLGFGAFSTVWLARDLADDHAYVALKINVARLTESNNESSILRHLQSQSSTHPGQRHVLALRDSFFVSGPNGKHEVIVTDVVTPLQGLKDYCLLKGHSKRICLQAILGLAYLQELGVSHGDLHFGNLACAIPGLGLQDWTEDRLLKWLGNPECVPLLPRDPSRDMTSLPKYLVPTTEILDAVTEIFKATPGPAICVKITDFGNAYRPTVSQPPPHIVTAALIIAPEIYFNLESGGVVDSDLGLKGDVWSLACTMHEIVFGRPVSFGVYQEDKTTEATIRGFGKHPPRWRPYWDAVSSSMGQDPPVEANGRPDEPVDGPLNLLGSMLRLDPLERPLALELLDHPWFGELEKPDFR